VLQPHGKRLVKGGEEEGSGPGPALFSDGFVQARAAQRKNSGAVLSRKVFCFDRPEDGVDDSPAERWQGQDRAGGRKVDRGASTGGDDRNLLGPARAQPSEGGLV